MTGMRLGFRLGALHVAALHRLAFGFHFFAVSLHGLGVHHPAHIVAGVRIRRRFGFRSEEHTSKLQSLMRISYAVFCLKKKKIKRVKTSIQKIDNSLRTYST